VLIRVFDPMRKQHAPVYTFYAHPAIVKWAVNLKGEVNTRTTRKKMRAQRTTQTMKPLKIVVIIDLRLALKGESDLHKPICVRSKKTLKGPKHSLLLGESDSPLS
jgi:hypothetical protein